MKLHLALLFLACVFFVSAEPILLYDLDVERIDWHAGEENILLITALGVDGEIIAPEVIEVHFLEEVNHTKKLYRTHEGQYRCTFNITSEVPRVSINVTAIEKTKAITKIVEIEMLGAKSDWDTKEFIRDIEEKLTADEFSMTKDKLTMALYPLFFILFVLMISAYWFAFKT